MHKPCQRLFIHITQIRNHTIVKPTHISYLLYKNKQPDRNSPLLCYNITNKNTAKGVYAVHEGREKVFYIPGKKRELLVAAPHHGYIPGSDYYTKEFAALLAIKLDGSLLYAENLRPLVDLNKNPQLASMPQLMELCCIYQQHALSEQVELFLEIHGHVNGHYDLELSCGFEFNPSHQFDIEFEERLASLRKTLKQEIADNWKDGLPLPPPSIGVFPFDQDVVMKATKTYLFQRIREVQLQGRRIYGIHIEIYKNFRTKGPDSPAYTCQLALVNALAQSINMSFHF